jgi:hypothetical protein
MRNKLSLIFLAVVMMAVVVTGTAAILMRHASGISHDLSLMDIENAYDPSLDTNTGFVIQPPQTVNFDRSMAVFIGASVSYILREVKAITMFTVILEAFALTAYVIIVYIVLNKITKPIVNTAGEAAQALKIQEHDKGESSDHAEEYVCSRAGLYSMIDEMLANIYSVTKARNSAGMNELYIADSLREIA